MKIVKVVHQGVEMLHQVAGVRTIRTKVVENPDGELETVHVNVLSPNKATKPADKAVEPATADTPPAE